jgi:hypothetical protein
MLKLIFATAALLGALLGGPALDKGTVETPTLEAPASLCPAVYAPVICDHDKIYPNQCVADLHHAKNCVPYLPEI